MPRLVNGNTTDSVTVRPGAAAMMPRSSTASRALPGGGGMADAAMVILAGNGPEVSGFYSG